MPSIKIQRDGSLIEQIDKTIDLVYTKYLKALIYYDGIQKPYNPKLAGVFFKSGMIEAWGRGFDKIREACAKYDAPLPKYNISASGIMVLCKACDKYLDLLFDEGDLHLGQSERNHDQNSYDMVMILGKIN